MNWYGKIMAMLNNSAQQDLIDNNKPFGKENMNTHGS